MSQLTYIYKSILTAFFLSTALACSLSETAVHEAAFDGNILVGRPTDTSVAISLLVFSDNEVYLEYGSSADQYTHSTDAQLIQEDDTYVFDVNNLEANTEYFYRIRFRADSSQSFAASSEYGFDTQKNEGSTFNFAVQADPHLGARTRFQKWCGDRCLREKSDDRVFAQTMESLLRYEPDFLVDLGDTFMTAQNHSNGMFAIQERVEAALITEAEVLDDVLYLRSLMSQAGSSVPIMLVQGNHEAEDSFRLDGTPDNLAVWAVNARKKYFPSPTDNEFYSGNTTEYDFIGRKDGYYSWEWGDALFVALDPFWEKNSGTPWAKSLGREQYDWLKETLADSDATFKFVFIHHLVGGLSNPYGGSRGGALYSDYFEWGGRTPEDFEKWDPSNFERFDAMVGTDSSNLDKYPIRRVDSSLEAYEFDTYRPGWGVSIQQLLIENNVQIVFHGHDHLYVKEEHPSGIIYQLVPTPARPGGEYNQDQLTFAAAAQGYDTENGVVFQNAGFLNVTVSTDRVIVDYVKNIEGCTEEPCSEIVTSYSVEAN